MIRKGHPRLTPAQRIAICRLALGREEQPLGLPYGGASWHQLRRALCDMGLAEPYVHGGYEATAEGCRVAAALGSTE